MKHRDVLRTGNMNKQSNYQVPGINYDSGERENCPREHPEDYGEHPEESTGIFDSLVE